MPVTKKRAISRGILLTLLFALATMFGAGNLIYYFGENFERDTCERYNDKQFEHAQGISRNISQALSLIQKDLEYIAEQPEVQQLDSARCWPILTASYHRFDGYVDNILLINSDGQYVCSYKERAKPGMSAMHRPSTVQAINTHSVTLAGPFTNLGGEKAIGMDVPIFRVEPGSDEKKFVGTVACMIEVDKWIKTYLTPYDMQLGGFTWIINEDRRIVVHSNSKLIGESWDRIAQASITDPNPSATDRQGDDQFLTWALMGKSGKTQIRLGSLGNDDQLVAYAPLRVAGAQWVVISNAPRKAVLQPFHKNLRNIWTVAAGFVVIFIALAIVALRDEKNQLDTERELRHSLQQSEKKYRLLIERSNDGILLTSPDGFIKLVNKRFTEMVGKNEEELLGQNILDYAAPAQRKMIEQEWQRRERGVSSSYELDLVKPVGSAPLTLIFSESPVFNRKNEHIANLAVLTDITDKKRAEEEIKHQNEEMFAVKAIAETANQSLILEEIFEATARKIYETLKLDGCLVASINEKARELNIRASIGFSPEFINDDSIKRIPLGVGFAGKAAEDGELVVIDDLSIDGYTLGERPALAAVQREGIISAAFIPIKVREACYGIIGCVSRSRRLFSERDIHLLNTIGQTIGLAVEKGRLYQNARRHAMRLETIYRVSDKLTGLLELDELLPALVKLIHDTFNYYNVNMMLYDKEHRQLVFTAGCGGFQRPEPIGRRIALLEGIIGNCFQRREPILVNDVSKEPNFMYMESLPETKAELAVPLMARSSAIGVLDVQSRFVNAFDDEDLLTLQALAEQIGVAIENAQLYERIKHSLDEVRKSQAFFAKIVLESPLSTFITESDGTCILINQSALALLGTNAIYDEVIGKYNLLSDPPFAAIQLEEKILAVLAGEVVQFNVDLPAIASETKRSLRDTITLRATFFPLMDDARKVANIVAMFEDLTEKKQLEEALQQAQKMESIGTLAGGIAHDFNNILGGVLGYTSFIKTKLSKGDSLYRYIDIIETSARRAADLTQQLLAFARGGKYRVQILDLNQVVREAIELIARSIPESISLTLKLAAMLPPLEGDGGQIIQTIVNMCINARDAMEQGGQLVIATSVADVGEAFVNRHPGAKLGTYVRLTVSDTGSGMSEETKQRIFEPFFTTKKDRKGTGLGLAMVYGIIKNHGGYIDVESEPGKGTAFLIHLPISSKPFENTARPTSRLPKFGRETILVAEDEDMMRDLIVEMLDSGGYQVISVDNGRKALDVYRERAREIDLVILDMIMPDLGGQEAFRQLKEINPGVKVLFSSGYSQDSQAQQIMSEGVLGFIQKPYAINELLDKIRLIIDCM